MPGRYLNGNRWRRVSDIEARFRRARGQEVIACEPAPAPPVPLPVAKLADLPIEPRRVDLGPGTFTRAEDVRRVTATPAADAMSKVVEVTLAEVTLAEDLTDAELERLTAPTKE